jgi:HEAT repeat protein
LVLRRRPCAVESVDQGPLRQGAFPYSSGDRRLSPELRFTGWPALDELDSLIEAFGSRGKWDHALWKLDILLDLTRLIDPRVVRFLAAIITDNDEPLGVRSEALSLLRKTALSPGDRELAASAALAALARGSDGQIRLRAAIVLGEFVDVQGVLSRLGTLAAADFEPTELRYNAYTSLQHVGPTADSVAILRSLANDETFGQSARALIASWGVR